jgi:exosortase A-associated hydrolase 1
MHAEWQDSALMFTCGGESLPAIISAPASAARVGVLVVVGGPQYRVGSHRQFVLLARHLAAHGVPVMRFDYRGMGDASGAARHFEDVGEDIAAAITAFVAHRPGLEKVVLWGLCDGASALCVYPPDDPRVAGMVLLNPWVQTEAGQAKVFLKHYYLQRLTDPNFWKKLAGGGVNVVGSVRSLFSTAAAASAKAAPGEEKAASLPERMAQGIGKRAGLPLAVFLSGRDYVAREFEQVSAASARWKAVLGGGRTRTRHFAQADHTFSGPTDALDVAEATLAWLREQGFATG